MQALTMVSLAAALALTSAAMAAEEVHRQMVIAVEDAGDGNVTRIEFDSEQMGFDLHDLQVGENRAFVDDAGRSVLVTREADGFTFDVDGEKITLPAVGPAHHPSHRIDGDVDVHVMHRGHAPAGFGPPPGVLIVSDRPIDEQTQRSIRALLESSGQDGEVRFIDGPPPRDGAHRIKIIEKKVETTD